MYPWPVLSICFQKWDVLWQCRRCASGMKHISHWFSHPESCWLLQLQPKQTSACLAGAWLSAIAKELTELFGCNLSMMWLFIYTAGLCLNIIMIPVICFQLLATLDRQLLKINLHKHNISFAQLMHFDLLLMLRGHRALSHRHSFLWEWPYAEGHVLHCGWAKRREPNAKKTQKDVLGT